MFRRLTRIGIFSLAGLSLGTLLFLGWPTESDYRAYRTAVQQSRTLAKTAPPICQNRQQVCKDIWFSNEGAERLHYRIESVGSSLTLQPVQKRIDIIEHLHDMRCWMQDKVSSAAGAHGSMQQSRYFTAQ